MNCKRGTGKIGGLPVTRRNPIIAKLMDKLNELSRTLSGKCGAWSGKPLLLFIYNNIIVYKFLRFSNKTENLEFSIA